MAKGRTIDFQEPLLLLRILRDVDVVCCIVYSEFFQGDANLVAIWRTARIPAVNKLPHLHRLMGGLTGRSLCSAPLL